MNRYRNIVIFVIGIAGVLFSQVHDWRLPIDSENRKSLNGLVLTKIGAFGIRRKARPSVPSHLHTGIDIKRPNNNYKNSPVFPSAEGVVISMRDDGPFAQIIIQHFLNRDKSAWTVYEHIADVAVAVGDSVYPEKPIARFMNKRELDSLGWQFDHLHFEVLKIKPRSLKPDRNVPQRLFGTYSLECYSKVELFTRYYNPMDFLKKCWK